MEFQIFRAYSYLNEDKVDGCGLWRVSGPNLTDNITLGELLAPELKHPAFTVIKISLFRGPYFF